MTLFQYLLNLNYTEAEAEETIIRYYNGMNIPSNILTDIKKYTFSQMNEQNREETQSK